MARRWGRTPVKDAAPAASASAGVLEDGHYPVVKSKIEEFFSGGFFTHSKISASTAPFGGPPLVLELRGHEEEECCYSQRLRIGNVKTKTVPVTVDVDLRRDVPNERSLFRHYESRKSAEVTAALKVPTVPSSWGFRMDAKGSILQGSVPSGASVGYEVSTRWLGLDARVNLKGDGPLVSSSGLLKWRGLRFGGLVHGEFPGSFCECCAGYVSEDDPPLAVRVCFGTKRLPFHSVIESRPSAKAPREFHGLLAHSSERMQSSVVCCQNRLSVQHVARVSSALSLGAEVHCDAAEPSCLKGTVGLSFDRGTGICAKTKLDSDFVFSSGWRRALTDRLTLGVSTSHDITQWRERRAHRVAVSLDILS